MKATFITIVSFFVLLMACSSQQKMMSDHGISINQAAYRHWSEAASVQSDVRERGTDLELIVENWPEGAEPRYIIYRKIKSFPVDVTDSTSTELTFYARIIRSSAVMSETSIRVEESDRLVFRTADGKTHYVEIEEWERMSD